MTGGGFVVAVSRDLGWRAQLAFTIGDDVRWRPMPFEGPAQVFATADCGTLTHPGVPGAMLLGTVFRRHGPNERQVELDRAIAQDLRRGSVDRLFAHCWGGYVALSSNNTSLCVIRDPSAAMPCYYASVPGGVLVGSRISALMAAGMQKPSIATDRIADCLYRADLPSQDTGLTGIRELLPGDCLQIDNDGFSVDHMWSPWDHVAIDEALDFGDHVERLRRAVQNSVAAWSSAAGPMLLGVSGGLDSSIIAACLNRKVPRPICVTLSTNDADGDERGYAWQITDHLGLTLVEARYDLADIAIGRPARPDLPRPTGRLIAQGFNAAVSRVAADNGVAAFITGNGGDNVFAFSQSAGAIADRLLHEGPSPGVWKTARDICKLTGCSLFEASRAALRILGRPRCYRWRPDRRLLSRNVGAELDSRPLDHPWLDAPAGALPGKAAHIASLLRIQRHLDGTGQLGAVAVINPLMSQPVIEACLAIPSWMWCREGRDRSVAREAFRAAMPQAIVDRTSKGGPDGFGTQIIAHFRDRIRERLLDGTLAREGVVDRAALERRFSDDRLDWGADQVRLLELLEAEAWIDHWRAR
jgi:asparagine synthase (glutamine-hydrolysing)